VTAKVTDTRVHLVFIDNDYDLHTTYCGQAPKGVSVRPSPQGSMWPYYAARDLVIVDDDAPMTCFACMMHMMAQTRPLRIHDTIRLGRFKFTRHKTVTHE